MDLDGWLAKVKQARSHSEVFAVLDDFRKEDFADDQRSKMAKMYMRILENLGPETKSDNELVAAAAPAGKGKAESKTASTEGAKAAETIVNKPAPAAEEDGPVWYEKM